MSVDGAGRHCLGVILRTDSFCFLSLVKKFLWRWFCEGWNSMKAEPTLRREER